MGPPNYWNKETIRANVFEKYSKTQELNFTQFDPKSIMLVQLPVHWIKDSSDYSEYSASRRLDKHSSHSAILGIGSRHR